MPTAAPPSPASATSTRVVIADDSPMMRHIVAASLRRAGVEVVGTATNGDEALVACDELRPDALMLDLTMPGLDGIGVLRAMRSRPRPQPPVIVVSAFSPAHGAHAVDALAEGAFDLVAKPSAGELDAFAESLVEKLTAATASRSPATPPTQRRTLARSAKARAVVITTSTGGPRALAQLLPELPARVGLGTLIVQHMPPGFTGSLAARLDRASKLTVREAQASERLDPAVALVAPGGTHLRLGADRRTSLTDEPEIGALRPRADLTISDASALYGERTLLVVMTGMGSDGLDGARTVKRAGGRVLVQDEASSTVYGMPRAVSEAGLADAVLPLHELAAAIAEEAGR